MSDEDDKVIVPEESFSSDEDFDDEDDADTESSSDVDAKLAEDDVFDIEFFKCYSALKKKDDKIYDKSVKFFNDEEKSSDDEDNETNRTEKESTALLPKKSKGPKMTLLDHQLNLVQDDLIEEHKIDLNKEISKSYYEKELEEIKRSIEKVGEDIGSDDDDDLLVVKNSDSNKQVKSKKKIDAILDEIEENEDEDLSHLKQIWSDPKKLTSEDKFLRDYIVNKLYVPRDPTESEGKKESFFSKNLDNMSDAEDEDEDETDGEKKKKNEVERHSDERNFDKITRIPRNSTKTIRDLVEKQEKKEKRMKILEKEKKRKKLLKDADCEDIVGDLPTRFHYRETEPNDYGLSAEELLMATDEELEQWVKLKDTVAYKSPEEELALKRKYEQKRDDIELKKSIFKSIYGDPKESEPSNEEHKSASKKSRKRKKAINESLESAEEPQDESTEKHEDKMAEIPKTKSKKKHKRGLSHKKFVKSGVAPDRLLAYGLSKTKLKKSKLL